MGDVSSNPNALQGRGAGVVLVRAALLVTLAELALLGSGRLVQLGPLTLRMWLFGAGLVFAAVHILARRRVDVAVGSLLLAFTGVTALGATVGLLAGASAEQLGGDLKPLFFFLSLAFFDAAIRGAHDVDLVAAVVRRSALVLAVGYLTLLALMASGALPFGPVYAVLNASGEFFFRGEAGFFYKGFLYLAVGFLFYAFRRGVAARCAAAVLFMALVLTLTRGLLLATCAVTLLAVVLRQRHALKSAFTVALLGSVVLALVPVYAAVFADRAESDAVRLGDVRTVADGTTWWSVLIGHGLGLDIGTRGRIEVSYLEILYKQGLVGLVFWGAVLLRIIVDYRRCEARGQSERAQPFLFGALLVFLESATNPFLTNPIGMSIVLVGLIAVRVLARQSDALGRHFDGAADRALIATA